MSFFGTSNPLKRTRGRTGRRAVTGKLSTALLRVEDGSGDKVVRNSLVLMMASGLMGIFGFAFWLVAARLYTPGQVGVASSLISAVSLIAYLSMIGLDVTTVRFMAKVPNRDALVIASIGLITFSGIVLSAIYVAFVPHYTPELSFVRDNILLAAGFCIICTLAAVNLFTDYVFMAFRRPEFNLVVDGLIQGVFKVGSVFVFMALGAYGIVLATGVGYAMATIASFFFMWRALSLRFAWSKDVSVVRRLGGFSLSAYVANALDVAPLLLLPVIALHSLGAEQAGVYFIAFQIVNLVNAISYAVAHAMFAEGSHDEPNIIPLVRKSARMLAMLLIPTVAVLWAGGSLVLRVVGAEYARQGEDILRLLLLGCLTVGVTSMVIQVLKLSGLMKWWIFANAVSCAVILGFAQTFASRGLMWVGGAWILGSLCGAAVAFVPFVLRRWHVRLPWMASDKALRE